MKADSAKARVQVTAEAIPEDVFEFWWESLQEALVPLLLELGVPDDDLLQEGVRSTGPRWGCTGSSQPAQTPEFRPF